MVTAIEYQKYLGVHTTPSNLERLEYLAIKELKSIMVKNIPSSKDAIYNDFKKAVMEQMNYFDLNSDLIDGSSSSGYTLGSYSESGSSQKDNSKSIDRISPMAYDILYDIGLLYSGLGGC